MGEFNFVQRRVNTDRPCMHAAPPYYYARGAPPLGPLAAGAAQLTAVLQPGPLGLQLDRSDLIRF